MEARFWQILDEARRDRPTAQERLDSIRSQLQDADRRALSEFHAVRLGWWCELSRRDLWAAAYTLLGGLSDDGFMDFRSWLLLQGRDAIEQVVRDPDSLADWSFVEKPQVLGFFGVAKKICEARGETLEQLDFMPDISHWPPDRVENYDWTDEDCARWFPRLWKRRVL